MCRNIRPLHNFAPPATDDEIREASLQFVRKISGMTRPSHVNEAAFDEAVERVAAATRDLLASLHATTPPHDRDVERERARIRFQRRQERERASLAG